MLKLELELDGTVVAVAGGGGVPFPSGFGLCDSRDRCDRYIAPALVLALARRRLPRVPYGTSASALARTWRPLLNGTLMLPAAGPASSSTDSAWERSMQLASSPDSGICTTASPPHPTFSVMLCDTRTAFQMISDSRRLRGAPLPARQLHIAFTHDYEIIVQMWVSVLPYDPAWATAFSQMRTSLSAALEGVPVISIEHVGSTSVPGLAAKPIIDIDIIVAPEDIPSAMELLTAHGYTYAPEPRGIDRYSF
ncbi:UPF0157-domain-containing protein, partial [Athelia psychrophila]